MESVRVGGRVLHQRPAGAASDGFVCRIDERCLLRLGVNHPEDFLTVIGHLAEFLLTVFKDSFYLPFGSAQLSDRIGRQ